MFLCLIKVRVFLSFCRLGKTLGRGTIAWPLLLNVFDWHPLICYALLTILCFLGPITAINKYQKSFDSSFRHSYSEMNEDWIIYYIFITYSGKPKGIIEEWIGKSVIILKCFPYLSKRSTTLMVYNGVCILATTGVRNNAC